MSFDPLEVQAIQDIAQAIPGSPILIIGAGALRYHLDLDWRTTMDLDLVLLADAKELEVLEGRGWGKSCQALHRWVSPGGRRIDIIPIRRRDLARGTLTWHPSEAMMSLAGVEYAFDTAEGIAVDSLGEAKVTSLAALAVLKMVAYLDRPAERGSDLSDLSYILAEFLPEDDGSRFELGALYPAISFEVQSPFVLGKELGGRLPGNDREVISKFIHEVFRWESPTPVLPRMAAKSAPCWRQDEDLLAEAWRAFRSGFEIGITDSSGTTDFNGET